MAQEAFHATAPLDMGDYDPETLASGAETTQVESQGPTAVPQGGRRLGKVRRNILAGCTHLGPLPDEVAEFLGQRWKVPVADVRSWYYRLLADDRLKKSESPTFITSPAPHPDHLHVMSQL
jgi:hypothetical protein